MRIGSSTNVSQYQYTNQMKKTDKNKEKSQEKLSSGKKINSAADDAAGLAISKKMMQQIKSLDQGSQNIQAGIDMSKIADGAMGSVSENLLDLQTNSIRAMNGTMSTDDKAILQNQAKETMGTIDHIANSTQYNEKKLTDGSTTKTSIYTGTDSEILGSSNMSVEALGLKDFSLAGENIDTSALDQAAKSVATARSTQGAQTNRLEASYKVNQNTSENTTAAYSRIVDTDMAKESVEDKKNKAVGQAQNLMLKNKMKQNENMLTKMF